jgi:predicted nucleic acid-binding protein
MAEKLATVLVADASVVVPLVAVEPLSEAAEERLSAASHLVAPSLVIAEVASALRRKVEIGEIDTSRAERSLSDLLNAIRTGTITLVRDEELALTALRIATAARHKVWDCFYIALAESQHAALVTADRKQARIAQSRGVEPVLLKSV